MFKSFVHAWNGLRLAISSQRNMKIHLLAMAVVIAIGFYFSFNYLEWSLCILSIGLVLGLEMLNTSLEELTNFVSPEKREEAKRIKDLAAGAVLIGAIVAFIVFSIFVYRKLSSTGSLFDF